MSLDRKLRRAYLHRGPEQASPATAEPITLRLARTQDDEALDRLARLEGLPAPAGPHVVAEVEGTIVAAMPLGTGPAFGDPFRPTAYLISLLEIRAEQLAGHRRRRLPVKFRRGIRAGAMTLTPEEG